LLFDFSFHFIQITASQDWNQPVDFVNAPIPPLESQQQFNQFIVKAFLNCSCRIPNDLRIWWNITSYNAVCTNDCTISNEPLEYARLYLEGNLQMWVDAEDSLEL